MVGRFGLSEKIGSFRLLASDLDVFLGNTSSLEELSETTHREMELETRRFVESAVADAIAILEQHRADLDALVDRLLEHENLEGAALSQALGDIAPTPVRFPTAKKVEETSRKTS